MTAPTIIEIDNMIYACAKTIIEVRCVEHRPLIMAFPTNADVTQVCVSDMGYLMIGESGKNTVASLITKLVATDDYDVVAFISEGWSVSLPNGGSKAEDLYAAGVRPTHHPERVEVLAVTYSLRGGERASVMHEIRRDALGPPKLKRGKLLLGAERNQGRFYAGAVV